MIRTWDAFRNACVACTGTMLRYLALPSTMPTGIARHENHLTFSLSMIRGGPRLDPN